MTMRGGLWLGVAAGCLWAAAAHAAAGFSISPFKTQLVPGVARGDSEVFHLSNTAGEPQAVEMRVERWRMDDAGRELNEPDGGSVEVYPRQFVLQPHATQAVRVRWKGGEVGREQAFRVVAEQLPVDFVKDRVEGPLRFLVVYRAALYVAPPAARPQVEVAAFNIEGEGRDRRLKLVLANTGTAHTLLRDPLLVVDGNDGTTARVQGKAVEGLQGQNIHAGARRVFSLPWPAGAQAEPKAVQLEFTPEF